MIGFHDYHWFGCDTRFTTALTHYNATAANFGQPGVTAIWRGSNGVALCGALLALGYDELAHQRHAPT